MTPLAQGEASLADRPATEVRSLEEARLTRSPLVRQQLSRAGACRCVLCRLKLRRRHY